MSEEEPRSTTDVIEPPEKKVGLVKAVGILGIIGGVLLIVVGVIAWIGVTTQLTAENITIPDDAVAFQGQQVTGPFTAYVQADIINTHALEASGGKTYAELDQDDPVRQTVMQASFLRASLFTSIVAYGVALFAAGMGVLAILFGWAIHRLASVPVVIRRSNVY
ncbi:aromatic ring-opening dioxygenase LigA [Microbacterium trichothecenolyticum]|uniref:Aromatic ring-opening dioxygenase LigA n=1 Tax=Microbacterium ureisolvens TaxID=2781186 RepID=A0ABS7HTY0_9MICO|nr:MULTISPECIES: aromatic ring-opening dioxygenase LigA [Microbacterium]MBW9108816.1 aromatic ring-opening dioxygenase LigA [Microbacterium ureisolvens]MBW9120668.1 aromatic ring-opening dioxygenase LigA [Microbacterium trichothecenolyticum]